MNKFLLLSFFLVFGCSFGGGTPDLRTERAAPADIATIEFPVSRKTYTDSFIISSASSVRLVPVTRGITESLGNIPEYRLFSIAAGSPADCLTLKNGDVLVAVNGFYLYDMNKFSQYLTLLRGQNGGSFEIRRENRPMMIKFYFQ